MADANVSLPQASAVGVRDPHTDTLHSIIMEILDRVPDPLLDAPTIVKYLNRGFMDVISRLAARGVFLPSLAAEAEIETIPGDDCTSLPVDWFGCLHGAYDPQTGRSIRVVPWTTLQRHRGPGSVRIGDICALAVYGKTLQYWMVPSSPKRIRIRYIRLPRSLAFETEKPFDLPIEFTPRMIADYAYAEAFLNFDSGANDFSAQVNDGRTRFLESVDILAKEIGPWPFDAEPITDVMGW